MFSFIINEHLLWNLRGTESLGALYQGLKSRSPVMKPRSVRLLISSEMYEEATVSSVSMVTDSFPEGKS